MFCVITNFHTPSSFLWQIGICPLVIKWNVFLFHASIMSCIDFKISEKKSIVRKSVEPPAVPKCGSHIAKCNCVSVSVCIVCLLWGDNAAVPKLLFFSKLFRARHTCVWRYACHWNRPRMKRQWFVTEVWCCRWRENSWKYIRFFFSSVNYVYALNGLFLCLLAHMCKTHVEWQWCAPCALLNDNWTCWFKCLHWTRQHSQPWDAAFCLDFLK